MNLWRLRRFSKKAKENRVVRQLLTLMAHPVFKGARFDVYLPTFEPAKVVFLLGQVHTVWKGKIGNTERSLIVNCQARLCSYYAYFEQTYSVTEFGGEGLYDGLSTGFSDRKCFELYEQIRRRVMPDNHVLEPEEIPDIARKILEELGKRWHEEIRQQHNIEALQAYASAVSGQTLFNYLTPNEIRVFPVEGEAEYCKVLEGVEALGKKILKLEGSFEFRAVKQRGNKIKDEKEASVIREYNGLVKEYNRILKSDIRERATLKLLLDRAKDREVSVLTMGWGHRRNYLTLVPEFFKRTDTAFVFITPPELLTNLWVKIGVPVLILLLLLSVFWAVG